MPSGGELGAVEAGSGRASTRPRRARCGRAACCSSPTKRAASRVAGCPYSATGSACCTMVPCCRRTMLSAIGKRLVLVVRDENGGRPLRRSTSTSVERRFARSSGVERRERLVEENDAGASARARGRARRADARRRRADAADAARARSGRSSRAARGRAGRRRPAGASGVRAPARTRCSRRRSNAGRTPLPAARTRSGGARAARRCAGPSTIRPPSEIGAGVGTLEPCDRPEQRRLPAARTGRGPR